MRLVGADGSQVGIKPLPEALTMARELGLDLVEVADKANPPVCRIMDYGKYKYEAAQKAKESRKKASHISIKEMKYRPKIGAGDFKTKTKKVEEFLAEGHKVKVTIMFRGREMQHPELGKKILDQVAEAVVHEGRVEAYPRMDGRNMTMVLGPDKKAQAAAVRAKALEATADAEVEEPTETESEIITDESTIETAPQTEEPTTTSEISDDATDAEATTAPADDA